MCIRLLRMMIAFVMVFNNNILVFPLQAKFVGCPVVFDSVSCWPATAPNTSAIMPCFTEFLGINYDGSRKYMDLSVENKIPKIVHNKVSRIFVKVHSTDDDSLLKWKQQASNL